MSVVVRDHGPRHVHRRAPARQDRRPALPNSSGALTAVAQLGPFAIRSDIWASLSGGTARVTVNPLVPGSGATILNSQFQITLTAIGQPLVGSANDSAYWRPATSGFVCADLCRFRQPAGTIIGFVYYSNWSYTSGSLMLGAARRRRADRQSKRVADDGLAVAGGACCGGRYRCFRNVSRRHAALCTWTE